MRVPRIAQVIAGVIVLGVGTVAVLALSASPAATSPTAPAAVSRSELWIELGGSATPLAEGASVAVAKGIAATMTLLSAGNGQHTLQVNLHDDMGAPITDATLQATVEMRFMEHGRATFVGLPAGANGSYVVPISFEMPGQWRMNLTVTAGSTTGVVHLEVDEFR